MVRQFYTTRSLRNSAKAGTSPAHPTHGNPKDDWTKNPSLQNSRKAWRRWVPVPRILRMGIQKMIGQKILHYKILEKLGEGGMGVVYKAEDTRLEREVAIKFLPREIRVSEEKRERLKIEAKAAAALNHPNIATVYSCEEVDDEFFIVMEFVDGQELREKIKSWPLELKEAIQISGQIAEGLQMAHEKGIVHRDIKSSNIMMTQKGQVKIMDFGLAKVAGGAQVTKEGTTVGTTSYMSPEQTTGEDVDQRSDIWSFGVLFYELLTGQLPFKGDYEQAILYSIVNEDSKPVSSHLKNIPVSLDRIVSKCLEKDKTKRYQTVSELLVDIQDAKDDLGLSSSTTIKKRRSVRFPISTNSRRIAVGLSGLIIVALFFLLAPRSWFGFETVPDQRSLLVLPFNNIGGESSRQAFCDGLVETLTSKVTQLEKFHGSLWVVPSSEVRQRKITSPSEANQTFGVNLCVTGSLQAIANGYRLTLNLVDAKNLRQLNSSVIDIDLAELSGLQDNAVIKMMEMLNLELKPEMRGVLTAGGTTVPGAYEFYIQGRGYLQRYESVENLDAAINLFERAIEQDTSYALAFAGLGEAYWQKYKSSKEILWVEKALKQCEKAITLNQQLAPVKVTQGIIHAGTGRYENAIADFKAALNIEPKSASAYRGLGRAYESKEMLEEAELTYRKAIEMKPSYWAGYNALGGFYSRHSRYEDAISQYLQVTNLTPDNYRGYNHLGANYYYLKRWKDAREMFERSLAIKATYGAASNLGSLYYIEGRFADAARTYESALELNEHNYVVWGNLASAYYWAPGMRDKAQETYERAIRMALEQHKVNPNNPDVVSNLAEYYAMTGEVTKALSYINQALEMSPKDVEVMYRAGAAYEQLGVRDKALHWIGKALENGYSRSEIEHLPELRGLVADVKYQQLVSKL